MNVTYEEMISVIASAGVSVEVDKIKSDTLLKKEIDSLEMMNVFLAIEEKYGIQISDEDVDTLLTVDDIIAHLSRH